MNKIILTLALAGLTALGAMSITSTDAFAGHNNNNWNNNWNNDNNDCQHHKDGKYNHQYGDLWCRAPVQEHHWHRYNNYNNEHRNNWNNNWNDDHDNHNGHGGHHN